MYPGSVGIGGESRPAKSDGDDDLDESRRSLASRLRKEVWEVDAPS